MLKNYFKIAWRNILKHRFYSLINIAGLCTGITFTLSIIAYIWSEKQVNSGLKNSMQHYSLQSDWKEPGMGYEIATVGELPKALKQQYPQLVSNYYRWDVFTSIVTAKNQPYRESIQIGDSSLIDIYGFHLLEGDASALNAPYSLLITEEKAKKYFGKTSVTGQTLVIENFSGNKQVFNITGVLGKNPDNSIMNMTGSMNTGLYLSSSSLAFFGKSIDGWNNMNVFGCIELKKGVTPGQLEKPIQQLFKTHAPPRLADNMRPYLVSLKKYHLTANNNLVSKILYVLSGIALFILLMATVNFVNLSINRSASRMREIGIRKVLGGVKKQLIFQFLTESILLVFFASLLAIVCYQMARPAFSLVLGKEIPSLSEFPLYFILFPAGLVLTLGIIGGLYPAIVLSSLKLLESLQGKLKDVKDNILLRKSLVAFQFATAIVCFTGAIIISRQVEFFLSQELGYNKNNILTVQVPRDWSITGVQKMEEVRRQIAGMPGVEATTLSFEVPNGNYSGNMLLYKPGSDSTTAIASQTLYTDEYYTSTYNIAMAAGEFYGNAGTIIDSSRIVVNETQAKLLGWKDPSKAVGQQLKLQGNNSLFTISGVTKDFYFGSMQQAIQPITFLHVGLTKVFRYLSVKLKPGNTAGTIDALQKKLSVLLPGSPFDYVFMNETLQSMYQTELQLKRAASVATGLSIFVVLLGILGLVALSLQKRIKEIGIRRILGSPVRGIILLFLKDFLPVVLVSGIAACPLAYWIMQNWLNDYAHRIQIGALPFIISITLLIAGTSCLIILQTFRTAMINPVKNLRTD